MIYDEHNDDLGTVVQADFVSTHNPFSLLRLSLCRLASCSFRDNKFLKLVYDTIWSSDLCLCNDAQLVQYHANDLLPLKDEIIVKRVMSCLSKCIGDFEKAVVVDKDIERFPKYLPHFFPGCPLTTFFLFPKSDMVLIFCHGLHLLFLSYGSISKPINSTCLLVTIFFTQTSLHLGNFCLSAGGTTCEVLYD